MKTDKSAAIIGMGCIFPKAAGLKQYWNLLFSGTDAITGIPEETHFSLKDFHDQDPSTPDHIYCKRGGFIPAVTFDPSRYGIPPKNLEATDTSQLLGLMVAEMALKDAGYPADQDLFIKKRTNVILGVTGTQELVIPLGARLSHPAWKRALDDSGIGADKKAEILKRLECSYNQWQENSFPGLLGNVVAGRIANRLDLGGTNTVVDAACASSLSAVNTALMELASGKCDMSITGGVDTLNDIFMHMCFSKTGVLSATSDARPFSADADGTVLGEGIGMVVLKRLEDAVRDNDRIYAVIRGVGTSSDGSTGGIYAPDAAGQKRALEAAYREASVDPSTVGFIEAHGTGTRVGDKIEFTALNDFMKQEQNSCAVGSVKSMIGHTKAAAGVAGMIKAALSLHHKTIFPTLKAENPDPELDIQNSSFYLNNQAIPWIHPEDNRHPRRAAVSAFGFGGSNFHAVLEEHQRSKTKAAWDGSVQIAAFSDDDTTGLKNAITGFIKEFRDADNLDQQEKQDHLARITARLRKTFDPGRKHRLAMVVNTSMDPVTTAEASLDIVNSGKPSCEGNADIFYGSGESPGCLGFLFPGQGSQYTGMGRDIASVFPEAMEAFSLFESAFARLYAGDGTERLSRYIFPLPAYQVKKKTAEALLTATDIAQPAIGALSLAMIRVLERFGIKPDFTCGHSFGELSALAAAGVIDDRTFAELSCIRGGLMAEAASLSPEKGGMLAVKAPLEDIEAFVASEAPGLVLANRNSPEQGVLSGSLDEIEKAYTRLKKKKIRAVKLPVAAAFHSELVAASAAPFAKALEKYPFSSGSIPVYSNTTGEIYPGDPAEAKKLLGRQLQNPVNFIMNIRGMMENRVSTFVEAGPGKVLSGLAGAIAPDGSAAAVPVDAVSSRKNGIQSLASVLARLSAMGYGVDLTQWEEKGDRPEQKRMRVLLTGANPKPENRCDIPPSSPDTLAVEKDAEPDVPDVKPVNNTGTPKGKSTDMHRQNSRFHEKQDQKTVSSSSSNASMDFEAMKMLKEGLDSIRQLQSETAKAHEKFLETQAETGRVLQSMMNQTRAYADHITGEAPLTPESMPAAENFQEHGPGNVEQPPDQKPEHGETAIVDTACDTEDAADTVRAPKTVNNDNKAAKSVWQTVSRLTGFPEEMLEGDMDIESDLGIDSIKKVEIVSELEKHFPEASGLTTETLGTVRTLDDICAAISGGSVQEPVPEQKDSGPAPNPSEQDNTTDSGFILDTLFKTVSNLTGFPQEMLEGDMDLESDLGIDSIKRVEILSALEKDLPRAGSISTDDAAGLKTIRDIAGFLDNQAGQGTESEDSAPIADTGEQDQKEQKTGNGKTTAKKKLARQRVSLKTHPVDQVKFYNGSRFSLALDRKVYISRDSSGLCLRFLDEFAKKGVAAEIIDITGDTVPDLPDAGGIVVLADPAESGAASSDTILKSAFLLANRNGEHLISAAEKKAAFFATVSFLGGAFGFDGTEFEDPLQGGLAGLSKTADLEWKSVECKAVDLPASIQEARENVETAVSLIMTHTAVEIGINGEVCHIPELVPDMLDSSGVPDISCKDVLVITGGARGVTAECAKALAFEFSPAIILIGRSPEPFAEPGWLSGLSSDADIKKALLENHFTGGTPKPVELEKAFKEYTANREILKNLEQIREAGSTVRYISADVTDADAVKQAFETIREQFGSVTCIIHGAGVLEDKLIVQKEYERFCKVLDTKVAGLNSLLNASRTDMLKYMICFSSIAARTGNTGQSDYAAANEVLNKTMQKLSLEQPGCRFKSINWGPWDGGMVNSSLKKEFENRGVDLIDPASGAAWLIREMGAENGNQVEVIAGADLFEKSRPKAGHSLSSAFELMVNPETCPVLNSHIIDNKYVVPFALLMEWKAYAAEKNNPGLRLSGMDRVRLLKGISFDDAAAGVQINACTGKCIKSGSTFETEAAVMSSHGKETPQTMNSACLAILSDRLPEPPVLSTSSFLDLEPCSMEIEQVYQSVLFHGDHLKVIKSITGVGPKGIEIIASTAGPVSSWIADSRRGNWTTDPALLDAAFQAAIIWTWERRQQVCLPAFMENFRLYSPLDTASGDIRIIFTVNEETEHKIRGYVTFLDEQNSIIAGITGFEAVMHKDLAAKFKKTPCLIPREKILAFAQGNPSEAFGEKYRIFDKERQMARLPRPPYFFMDRVTKIDHEQWRMEPGGWIEAEFDIPADGWFFRANRTETLPFCILLEIALQPCGWLAAWAGSALTSDERLYFRNLGGNAALSSPVQRTDGTLTMRCRMTDVSSAGHMIIQDFDIEVFQGTKLIYKGTTNFGFFTASALANQVGIQNSRIMDYVHEPGMQDKSEPVVFEACPPLTPEDPETGINTGMPATALLMIDRIDTFSPDGGIYQKGYIKASKTVNPEDWFFKAHFYQDPVCPGSLGIESFIQMIRYFLLEQWNYDPDRYQVDLSGKNAHQWKYRGQITPSGSRITVHAHIREISAEDPYVNVVADGALAVDGICIYEMENFTVALSPAYNFSILN